ncbi:hypothetical protein [Roseomonas xinghualingensis]|uniref:hypothetical protein n=1 Tax=Roseomonas xinghualingensis TaxID=2986475 RepID=UPI0021F1BF58|nr:hypothetical protein [Roseomonas sp. SXEYE001]MCV4206441.1 hypothetical protein [Roseomonas sp. SXEYE001]
MPPAAVMVVSVPSEQLRSLSSFLHSLACSRAAGDVAVAPGALAVLILTDEAAGHSMAEAMDPEYPFALRVEAGPDGVAEATRRAAAWARSLGAAGVPVLFAPVSRPVEPRWVHGVLALLRDGADLVMPRRSFWERLFARPALPVALSHQAQGRIEQWSAQGAAGQGAAWTRWNPPWRRPAMAGLRAVTL